MILAAHGAGDGSEANRRVLQLADALRALRPHARFECAFWRGTPSFYDAARAARGRSPAVVPIMTSDGYYARHRLPEELAKGDPSRSFVITPPIGTLPAFSRVMIGKVLEAVASTRDRGLKPAVLLVGHGTRRVGSSGDVARRLRDEVALSLPHTEVLTAFLDEPPYLSDVAGSLGDRPLVAAPVLLGGGPHVLEDLARALKTGRTFSGSGATTGALTVLPSILEWPELVSITLEAIDGTAHSASSLDAHPHSGREAGPRANASVPLPSRAGSPPVP